VEAGIEPCRAKRSKARLERFGGPLALRRAMVECLERAGMLAAERAHACSKLADPVLPCHAADRQLRFRQQREDHLVEDCVLSRHVVVQRGNVHREPLRDAAQRHRREPLLVRHLDGDGHDVLARKTRADHGGFP
jgi:hypothetical protein